MKKGKYGVNLVVFALLCIAFAILRQPLAVLLICGYAIIVEKDVTLNKTVIITAFLMVINIFIRLILNGMFSAMMVFFRPVRLSSFVNNINSFFNIILFLVFFIIYIMLAIGAIKGKEIKASFIDKLVSKEETEEN